MATKKKPAPKKAVPKKKEAAKKPALKKKFKSAVTGKFVKPEVAKASPSTTFSVSGKKKKS